MALGLTGRTARKRAAQDARQASDALYEMANLFPRTTGLPMTIWVSPRGRARHDARIKVSLTQLRLIEGRLSPPDLESVVRWVSLNEAALLDFWNETIDSVELGVRLRKI